MATCNVANGRILEPCKDWIGSIKAIYIINQTEINTNTYTYDGTTGALKGFDMLTTAITDVPAYKYVVQRATSTFSQNIVTSEENGTIVWEQTVEAVFNKLTTTDVKNIKVMAQGQHYVFIEDNNRNVFMCGKMNGCTVTGSVTTGTAWEDRNGFSLTFTAKEQEQADFVEPYSSIEATNYPFDGMTILEDDGSTASAIEVVTT